MIANSADAGVSSVKPLVSVIVACYNEQRFIARCLDSILFGSYPLECLEVLVVDGMSTDETRQIVRQFANRHSAVKLLDNPRRITPVGFNIGVRAARGELIMIMSAHAAYDRYAIERCVQYSQRFNAENVGGVCVTEPRGDGMLADAIVAALSHPFGVGGSAFRTGNCREPRWADTAAFGCYRRDVFERIGLWNEQLVFSQDIEFNLRLKQAGGHTLLVRDIVVRYQARTDLRTFVPHNFRNGYWAIMPFAYSDVMPVGWRHLVPMVFVGVIAASAAAAIRFHSALWVTAATLGAYLALSFLVALRTAIKQRNWKLVFVMPLVFGLLHVPYGLGSMMAALKISFSKRCHRLLLLPLQRRTVQRYGA